MNKQITITKRIHQGYTVWNNAKKRGINYPQLFGKYQFIYASEKGEISLVLLLDYLGNNKDVWEIFSLIGEVFEDVEKFETKKEAEKRIEKLLLD